MNDTGKVRLDKWLWFARFFKTRSIAAKVAAGGKVRINGVHAKKASATVLVGDVLTFAQSRRVRVIEIAAIGERRGPASEAAELYVDLSPPETARTEGTGDQGVPQARTGARPTKRARRQMDKVVKRLNPTGVEPDGSEE